MTKREFVAACLLGIGAGSALAVILFALIMSL